MGNSASKNKKKLSFGELAKASWKNGSFLYIFIVMFLFYISVNNYITWNSITNILKSTAVIGTLSLGMGLIIISGDIDLSVGANFAFSGGMGILVYKEVYDVAGHGLATFVSILVIVAVATIIGFINGIMVGKLKMPAFIATLGTMLIFRSLCKYILKAIPTDSGQQQQTYQLIDYYSSPYYSLGNESVLTIPIVGIILIVFVLLVYYFAKHTKFGRRIYALGSNSKAASLAGINVPWTKATIFAIAGAFVGLSAVLHVSIYSSMDSSTAGMSYELYAIASCVIGGISMNGGRGNIIGILFGALSFQIIDKIISAVNLNPLINDTIKGAILLVSIILQLIIFDKKAFYKFLETIGLKYNPEQKTCLEAKLAKKINSIKLSYDKKIHRILEKDLDKKEAGKTIGLLLDERDEKIAALTLKYDRLIDDAAQKFKLYERERKIKEAKKAASAQIKEKAIANKAILKKTRFQNGKYLKPTLEKEIALEKELLDVQEEAWSKVDELVLDISIPQEVARHIYDRDRANPSLDQGKLEVTFVKFNESLQEKTKNYNQFILDRKKKEKEALDALIAKNEALIDSNKGLEEGQIKENKARLEVLEAKNKTQEEKKAKREALKKEKIEKKLDLKKANLEKEREREEFLDSIKQSRSLQKGEKE
ncbi:MAG: hypothetical protein SPH43_05645 [Candidatus Enteromonas sp.]|nr:hypothetical protein [Candidatus Enteromonas sp.]